MTRCVVGDADPTAAGRYHRANRVVGLAVGEHFVSRNEVCVKIGWFILVIERLLHRGTL